MSAQSSDNSIDSQQSCALICRTFSARRHSSCCYSVELTRTQVFDCCYINIINIFNIRTTTLVHSFMQPQWILLFPSEQHSTRVEAARPRAVITSDLPLIPDNELERASVCSLVYAQPHQWPPNLEDFQLYFMLNKSVLQVGLVK